MGECYWHGYENPCPECEKDQVRIEIDNKYHKMAAKMTPKRKYCTECRIFYPVNKKHKCKKEN